MSGVTHACDTIPMPESVVLQYSMICTPHHLRGCFFLSRGLVFCFPPPQKISYILHQDIRYPFYGIQDIRYITASKIHEIFEGKIFPAWKFNFLCARGRVNDVHQTGCRPFPDGCGMKVKERERLCVLGAPETNEYCMASR